MKENENNYIVKKNENQVIISDIPKKYINNDHKLMIRLKNNYAEYNYLFKKMINIENENYIFDVGNFGYYECEIFDCENELVFEESDTFLGNFELTLDTKTSHGIVRSYFEFTDDEFQENTMVLINKMEKTYFEQPELAAQVKTIFEEFKKYAVDFVYIQDPYFDYNSYRDLIENLPRNLVVKALYIKGKAKNIPAVHNMTLIEDNEKNGRIHDRYIVTKHFGYYIGISLNGTHKNKSSFNKIRNTENVLKYFE